MTDYRKRKSKFVIKGIRRFDEKKVMRFTKDLMKAYALDCEMQRKHNTPSDVETESCTWMAVNRSTQGVNIKRLRGEVIIVELPWLASEMDVSFCYAFLNSVKKVYRGARIMDEEERYVGLTDCDAQEQWKLRFRQLAELVDKGEYVVLKGVNRDFHFRPCDYTGAGFPSVAHEVYERFLTLQWRCLDYGCLVEEKRDVADEERILRVVDHRNNVFIEPCQYVGMMKDNTCKMLGFDDFCTLMEDQQGFVRVDAAQALLPKMDRERWYELFDKAKGIVVEHFRKTFIMRWNTETSNFTLSDFEKAMSENKNEKQYFILHISDYQQARLADEFFMIRTGKGNKGVVMYGMFDSMPFLDEDLSSGGQGLYRVVTSSGYMVHPDDTSALLTTDVLAKEIPDFNWEEGPSGVMLTDEQAEKLEALWLKHLFKVFHVVIKED